MTSAVFVVEERTLRGETTNADCPPTTARYLIPEGVAHYGNSLVGTSTLERLLCDARRDTVVMSGVQPG